MKLDRSPFAMRLEPLANHQHRIDEIAQLLHEEWGYLPPWSSQSLIAERLKTSSSGQPFPLTFIALSTDGRLLGTASVKLRELANHVDKEHWLGEVFVPKELRGQGIGFALIRCCIEYTFNTGSDSLYLYTPDQQSLYRRFGWIDVEETHVNGETVTIMELKRGALQMGGTP